MASPVGDKSQGTSWYEDPTFQGGVKLAVGLKVGAEVASYGEAAIAAVATAAMAHPVVAGATILTGVIAGEYAKEENICSVM